MKIIRPEKIAINRIHITSIRKREDEVMEERRVFLGIFLNTVMEEDIRKSLNDHDLWHKVLTSDFYAQGKSTITMTPGYITEGVVFENANEFGANLKNGISYSDILDGCDYIES